MRKTPLIRRQVIIFLILVLSSYLIALLIAIALNPPFLANIFGFLSLLVYVVTVLPSILKKVFPQSKKDKILNWLLKYRRYTGVAAFGFGLNHGVLLTLQRQLDLLDPQTYLHYFQGGASLVIFTLLAITSNDQTVKLLKTNWRKLHRLTYLAIFLLPWHVLDKMANHWSHLTPFAVLISVSTAVLFMRRKQLEQLEENIQSKVKKTNRLPANKV